MISGSNNLILSSGNFNGAKFNAVICAGKNRLVRGTVFGLNINNVPAVSATITIDGQNMLDT